jgi:hypothetical protein
MKNLNEHVNRMKQLFNAQHGIIKPLVKEQDEFDDLISKTSPKSADDSSKNQTTTNQSNSNYKNANDSFEDKDDMVNKPGSGKKIVAVVDANIKNNTKKTEEIVKLDFKEDQNANDYLGDPNLGQSTKDILKDDYGYTVWGNADKTNYSSGDSISITATIPLVLGNSTIDKWNNKGNINLATKSNSGNNTTIQINGSIVENNGRIYPIRIRYDVNEDSPFGPKKQLTLHIAFK